MREGIRTNIKRHALQYGSECVPFYVGIKNRHEGLTESVRNGIIMLDDISRDIVAGGS